MPLERAPSPTTTTEPAVATSVASGVRRLLIEEGRWMDVRARLIEVDPHAAEWLDAPLAGPWFPFERHLAIMRALEDVRGDEGLRAAGRTRMRESVRAGALAPIFRSWARSYSGAPVPLLRVTPHAWSAVTRNLGTLKISAVHDRALDMAVTGAPEIVRRATSWQRFLEGYGLGVLELGGLDGEVSIRATDTSLVATIRWR